MKKTAYVKNENFIDKMNTAYRKNPQKYHSIFFLVIAAVIIIFFVSLHIKRKEARIIELYLSASNVYNQQKQRERPNYQRIIDEYNKVIDLQPSSDYAISSMFVVAEAHFQLDNLNESIEIYNRLIKRTSKGSYLNYQALLGYATVLKEAEKYDESINVLKSIIDDKNSPSYAYAPASIYLALIYINQKEYSMADEYLTKVIEKYSDTFWADQALLTREKLEV